MYNYYLFLAMRNDSDIASCHISALRNIYTPKSSPSINIFTYFIKDLYSDKSSKVYQDDFKLFTRVELGLPYLTEN